MSRLRAKLRDQEARGVRSRFFTGRDRGEDIWRIPAAVLNQLVDVSSIYDEHPHFCARPEPRVVLVVMPERRLKRPRRTDPRYFVRTWEEGPGDVVLYAGRSANAALASLFAEVSRLRMLALRGAQAPPTCRRCCSQVVVMLGRLGALDWVRCRDCGWEWSLETPARGKCARCGENSISAVVERADGLGSHLVCLHCMKEVVESGSYAPKGEQS